MFSKILNFIIGCTTVRNLTLAQVYLGIQHRFDGVKASLRSFRAQAMNPQDGENKTADIASAVTPPAADMASVTSRAIPNSVNRQLKQLQ